MNSILRAFCTRSLAVFVFLLTSGASQAQLIWRQGDGAPGALRDEGRAREFENEHAREGVPRQRGRGERVPPTAGRQAERAAPARYEREDLDESRRGRLSREEREQLRRELREVGRDLYRR